MASSGDLGVKILGRRSDKKDNIRPKKQPKQQKTYSQRVEC